MVDCHSNLRSLSGPPNVRYYFLTNWSYITPKGEVKRMTDSSE